MDFKKEFVSLVVPFSSIREGELFENHLEIYLKIDEVEDIEWSYLNAVNIQTGEVVRFKDEDPVYKATADITVKIFK